MRVSPARLERILDRYELSLDFVPGWNSATIDPYHGTSDFVGVLLHHTAGVDSLAWVSAKSPSYPYRPIRACHFLSGRNGTIDVVCGVGCYHAGEGGPIALTKAVTIPKNGGNSRLFGIEIESLGTSPAITSKAAGMDVVQVVETAMLSAALLEVVCPIPGAAYSTRRVILHRTYAPLRKVDVKQDLDWWRNAIAIARTNRAKPLVARREVRKYVQAHTSGRLAA